MRIALLGQAAFGERALEELLKHGEEVVHVFAPPDPDQRRPDPLKVAALNFGIPVSQLKSFKSDEAYELFKSLDADLAILAFATVIVPERILYLPRYKSICFHPSILPRHRGASAINWAIIQGDLETGVTWFWPDKGIDTGPILIQRRVPISPDDSAGSLYFNRLFPLGIETMLEAVVLIKGAKAPAIAQDESAATYEPPCRDEHARVDFRRPARDVYNLIRGCDPQPGAHASLAGRRLRLYDAGFDPARCDEEPGTIVSIGPDGMRIAALGGTIVVRRLRIEPSPSKLAPAELEKSGALALGAKLE